MVRRRRRLFTKFVYFAFKVQVVKRRRLFTKFVYFAFKVQVVKRRRLFTQVWSSSGKTILCLPSLLTFGKHSRIYHDARRARAPPPPPVVGGGEKGEKSKQNGRRSQRVNKRDVTKWHRTGSSILLTSEPCVHGKTDAKHWWWWWWLKFEATM